MIEKVNFRSNPQKIREIKFKMIKKNFEHHFKNNPFYRKYCELLYEYGVGEKITPEKIKEFDDLLKIPLIPSDFFKELSKIGKEDLIITKGVEIKTHFTTSGTTGTPTKYLFDEESLKLTNAETIFTCSEVLEVQKDDWIIFLTPLPERSKTGLVQGAYRMFKGIVGDNIHFLYGEESKGKPSELLETILKKIEEKCKGKIHLYGPPFLYYQIAEELKHKNKVIKINGKAMITGGWKKLKGAIPRQKLHELITERLNIHEKEIRDGLGLTDIFTWCPECEYHKKHIPLEIYVSVRNPENINAEMESGKEGLLAFMSPYIKSFPPFVITGDIGVETVSVNEYCECGRVGNAIEHRRRARGTLPRGCALVLEELIKKMENG